MVLVISTLALCCQSLLSSVSHGEHEIEFELNCDDVFKTKVILYSPNRFLYISIYTIYRTVVQVATKVLQPLILLVTSNPEMCELL